MIEMNARGGRGDEAQLRSGRRRRRPSSFYLMDDGDDLLTKEGMGPSIAGTKQELTEQHRDWTNLRQCIAPVSQQLFECDAILGDECVNPSEYKGLVTSVQSFLLPVDGNIGEDPSAVPSKMPCETCHSVALSSMPRRGAHNGITESSQIRNRHCFSGDSRQKFANRSGTVGSQEFERMTSECLDNIGNSSQAHGGYCKQSSIEEDLASLKIEDVMKNDSTNALCTPAKEKGLAVFSDVYDSPAVRIGSPAISGLEGLQSQKAGLGASDIDGMKRSLDCFVFDMDQHNGYSNVEGRENTGLHEINLEGGSIYRGQLEKLTPPPLSPFSKMIVKLDYDCSSTRELFQDSNCADMNHQSYLQEKLLSRLRKGSLALELQNKLNQETTRTPSKSVKFSFDHIDVLCNANDLERVCSKTMAPTPS
eukprot:c26963_g2_i2 orf=51-1313(-)